LRTNRANSVRDSENSKSPPASHSVSARPSLAPQTFHRFETYLHRHALSPATIRNYLADLRAFARWHTARQSIRDGLSPADFRAYRGHLCNKTAHSPATVNRRLQSLRLFGRFLHETGQSADNPTRDIQLVRNGSARAPAPRTLTRAEIVRLLAAVHAARRSLAARDLAIVQLMLQAGLHVHQVDPRCAWRMSLWRGGTRACACAAMASRVSCRSTRWSRARCAIICRRILQFRAWKTSF